MATPRPRGSARSAHRARALATHGALHPHPQDVTAALFQDSAFFDPRDVVQVKYEMLRRVRTERASVTETAADFGFSRPAFYQARAAFTREGLPGLLPRKRGPKRPHKLTDEVLAVLATAGADTGGPLRATALAALLTARFGIVAHPRSIERSLRRYHAARADRAGQEKKR
jgi:transposase